VFAQREAAEKDRAKQEAEQRAALKRWQEQKQRELDKEPKWGTKEAKWREIERIRKEIEDRKK